MMKEFSPFRLDAVNQCLWRHADEGKSERILMTPKAFGILRHLVENPERLITHDELLESLWPGTYVQPEVLKSHIRDIREVLGDDSKSPTFIETLPRRGYRFIAHVTDNSNHREIALEKPGFRLVGRTSELDRLERSVRSALRGERQLFFVTGEPGIGKTSLVDVFQQQARSKFPGIQIARGQCVEGFGGKEPYYPMLEALGQLIQCDQQNSISRILASQAPTWLLQFPSIVKRDQRERLQRETMGASRERMLREIADALETITANTPIIFVFEDLQWVDPSTVDLISALARRRQQAKLLIIGTYRPVDVLLTEHPLKNLKQELLVHHLCQEITLEALGEAEVSEYLASRSLGTRPPDGLAAVLYRHSEGNPLFMVAALNHLCDRGLVFLEDGNWHLSVPLAKIDLEAPESLNQMIDLQIERLTDEEQRVLAVMSLLRQFPLSVAVGSAVANIAPERLEELLERLAKRHQMIRHVGFRQYNGGDSATYEFVHVIYRDVLYRRIGPVRRRMLHRRMGEIKEAVQGVAMLELAAELAYQFEEGDDWPRAIKYLVLEAKKAGRRYEPRQAADILEHALELANRIPEGERAQIEVEILQDLATIYATLFDPRALETYDVLAARAARYGLTEVEVRALAEKAYPAAWVSAAYYLETVERARQADLCANEGDPIKRAALRCLILSEQLVTGTPDPQVLKEYWALVRTVREKGGPRLLAEAESCYILLNSSRYRAAYQCSIKKRELMTEGFAENPFLSWNYPINEHLVCTCLLFLGEWGEAIRATNERLETNQKNAGFLTPVYLFQGIYSVMAHDFEGARQILEEALPLLAPNPSMRRFCLIYAGCAQNGLGDFDRALEHLLTCRDEMEQHAVMNDWHNCMQLQWGLVDAWLGKGNRAQARVEAEQFLKVTLMTEEHTYRAIAYETNARISIAEGNPEVALECVKKAELEMEGYEVPLAAWRVHWTAQNVYQCLGELALSEAHRALSVGTIMKLANSLPEEEPLRRIFLSSQPIRSILRGQ